MDVLYLREIVNNLIGAILMTYFFNNIMPPRSKRFSSIFTIMMIIVYTLISIFPITSMFNIANKDKVFIILILFYLLVMIYPIIFRKGRLSEKIFLSAFYITIMVVSFFSISILMTEILSTAFGEIISENCSKRSLIIIFNRIVQGILVLIFLKNINFIRYMKGKTLYIGAGILGLSHILVFILQHDLVEVMYSNNTYIIIVAFSLCIIQLLLIQILNTLSREIEEKFILKMNLDRKVHDEEIVEMYTQMNGWKHDFRNHINVILGLLQVASKEEAISYIKEIDTSIRNLENNIYTDNFAINSILISKFKVAEEKDIKINLDLKMNWEVKISNVDICTILGNLLDNSIEACNQIEGYKFIDLTIASEENKLVIKIINNTNGKVNEVNGRFITTKNNYINGIGLMQVDNTVKKYKGYINRKHENNIFTTYIMIQYEN